MPRIPSSYTPPPWFRNGHVTTVYSGLFRTVTGVEQIRERLELSDGDFLDLDWSYAQTPVESVTILLHGLEGNAQRAYMLGSAKHLNAHGYDACAVNFRGCSGKTNRLFRSYHSGATEDLAEVLSHIINTRNYSRIYLLGFSLGANLALTYLGRETEIPANVTAAVAISAPCDLYSALTALSQPVNFLYARRFRKHLVASLRAKQQLFPELLSDQDIRSIRTMQDFDEIYTSRAHGFADAMDYYQKSSCGPHLQKIQKPVLMLNALDDSFLGQECYPFDMADRHQNIFLETPKYGGHVGFNERLGPTYAEKRLVQFLAEIRNYRFFILLIFLLHYHNILE